MIRTRYLHLLLFFLVIMSNDSVCFAGGSGATPCFLKSSEAGNYVAGKIREYKTDPLTEENACKIVAAYDVGLEKLQVAERICIEEYREYTSKHGYREYLHFGSGLYLIYNEMKKSRANYAKKCSSSDPVTSWEPASIFEVEKSVFDHAPKNDSLSEPIPHDSDTPEQKTTFQKIELNQLKDFINQPVQIKMKNRVLHKNATITEINGNRITITKKQYGGTIKLTILKDDIEHVAY